MRAQLRYGVMALGLAVLALLAGSAKAGPIVVLDEFGHGTYNGAPLTTLVPTGLPYGPVGYFLPPSATFTATQDLALVLSDPPSPYVGDLLTFFHSKVNGQQAIVFGSNADDVDPVQPPADTTFFNNFLLSTLAGNPQYLILPEQGTEANNGLIYTPLPNQPGYFSTPTGGPTYVIISDGTGVPEPSTLALLALGGGALAGWRRWRKRRPA